VEDWTSILRLATKFKFSSLRELAVERLFDITSPLDKVILAHTFELPEWLPLAYAQICDGNQPLTVEEGRRLGELGPLGNDIIIRLWQTCHEMRSFPIRPVTDIIEIVKRIFELNDLESETSSVHENTDDGTLIDPPFVLPTVPAYLQDCQERSPTFSPPAPSVPLPIALTTPLIFGSGALRLDNIVDRPAVPAPKEMLRGRPVAVPVKKKGKKKA
jgi:hypothetical protein